MGRQFYGSRLLTSAIGRRFPNGGTRSKINERNSGKPTRVNRFVAVAFFAILALEASPTLAQNGVVFENTAELRAMSNGKQVVVHSNTVRLTLQPQASVTFERAPGSTTQQGSVTFERQGQPTGQTNTASVPQASVTFEHAPGSTNQQGSVTFERQPESTSTANEELRFQKTATQAANDVERWVFVLRIQNVGSSTYKSVVILDSWCDEMKLIQDSVKAPPSFSRDSLRMTSTSIEAEFNDLAPGRSIELSFDVRRK